MIRPPPLSFMPDSHNTAAAARNGNTTAATTTDSAVNQGTGSPSNLKKKQQDLAYFKEQVERQKEKTRRLQQQRHLNAEAKSSERPTTMGDN